MSDKCFDALSEPRSEQAGVKRTLLDPNHRAVAWPDFPVLFHYCTVPEVTKTLELHFVNPTVHKERKLHETRDAYQRALQAEFAAGCDTQAAANDVVVEYDLSGHAENALKKHVPQLHNSYDAEELHDDHPVRFTSEGLQVDHQPQNAIE